MNPYTTMGQARIQQRDSDAVLFTEAFLAAVSLAALADAGRAVPSAPRARGAGRGRRADAAGRRPHPAQGLH